MDPVTAQRTINTINTMIPVDNILFPANRVVSQLDEDNCTQSSTEKQHIAL